LPTLLWLAAAVCASLQLCYMFSLRQAETIPAARRIQPYYHAFFATSLAVNIFTTAFIVYRIWAMQKLSSEFFTNNWRGTGRVNLSQVNRIFVESALLYTLSVAITLVTELSKSNGTYGASDVSLELAGISFDLIIIRIWSGVSIEAISVPADNLQAGDLPCTARPTKVDEGCSGTCSLEMTTRQVM